MTSRTRSLAVAVLTLRVVYGAALIARPERLTHRWLGPDTARAPTQVPLRGLGTREIVVHGAALVAARRGDRLGGYLAASVAGDVSDILATLAGRRELPDGAAAATIAVAGGSALLTAAVAVLAER